MHVQGQPALRSVLHRCNLLRNEMLTFASTLVSYVMFEVLEIAWAELEKALKSAASLADVIAAHDKYLATILTKQLMGPTTASIAGPLQALLDVALRFAAMQEQLYGRALAEAAQLQRHQAAVDLRTDAGGWGTSSALEESEGSIRAEAAISRLAAEFSPRLTDISVRFRSLMAELLDILEAGSGEVEEFSFLSFRIDFNSFYTLHASK